MKRLLLTICPFILLAAGLSSCSEDFKVDAPYKPITVVYGLLNPDSTRNYIRIQKAFLDENISALVMAQEKDSNYFANLSVHLKEMNNGVVVFDEPLTQVDLAAEGFPPKDSGTFFRTPNYAYKTTRTLNPAYRYRLVVSNSATGEIDSAETPIISTFANTVTFRPVTNPAGSISFEDNPPTAHNAFSVTFSPGDSSRYFEGVIRFHYVDKNVNNGVQTDRFFDWQFATAVRDLGTNNAITLSVPQSSFYPVFSAYMGSAPAGVERYIDTCELSLYAGSNDFYTYLLANNAQGGLTGDQVRPSYTNIKGAGVLGLFASRRVRVLNNVPISLGSINALQTNVQTQNLNIKGLSDH